MDHFTLIVSIFVGFAIISAHCSGVLRHVRRRDQLENRARQLLDAQAVIEQCGLDHFDLASATLLPWTGSRWKQIGRSRRCQGMFERSVGDVRACGTDFQFEVSWGKTYIVCAQTMIVIEFADGTDLPDFFARPRSCTPPWIVTGESVSVHPIIDMLFEVESFLPYRVRDFFDFSFEEGTETIIDVMSRHSWIVECDGSHMTILELDRLTPPEQLGEFLDDGLHLALLFRERAMACLQLKSDASSASSLSC